LLGGGEEIMFLGAETLMTGETFRIPIDECTVTASGV